MSQQVRQERNVGLHPAHAELSQAAFHFADRVDEATTTGRDLHHQRIVVGSDHSSGERGTSVETDAHSSRRPIVRDPAIVGCEVVLGILGRDAALDRVAVGLDRSLARHANIGVVQTTAHRDKDLRLHDVEPGHFFGDRVFDLDAGVHFNEEELVRVSIDQKLDRTGVLVTHLFANIDSCLTQGIANLRVKIRCRGQFNHLLMPTLHRAVAFVQVDEIAMLVTKQLDFDMAGAADVLLDKDVRAAERSERLAPGRFVAGDELVFALDHPHPATATAVGCFEDDGITELLGCSQTFLGVLEGVLGPAEDRCLGQDGNLSRGGLVTEGFEVFDLRPDEDDSGVGARLRKGGLLGQESVPGMDRVGPGLFRSCDD